MMASKWTRCCAASMIILATSSNAYISPSVPASTLRRQSQSSSSILHSTESSPDSFESLGLSRDVLQSVRAQPGWTLPTPIQGLAIPQLLESDDARMAAWCEAPTGSGKTAAFILPLLQRLLKSKKRTDDSDTARISSLILCPTRELAVQIGAVAKNLSSNVSGRRQRWNIQVIHGGIPLDPQITPLAQAARDGNTIDIVVATPGRLVDVLTYYENDGSDASEGRAARAAMERRLLDALDAKGRTDASLSLSQIEDLKLDRSDDDGRSSMLDLLEGMEYLVMDEADRLLGGAFESEMNTFLKLLGSDHKFQTWLFSATFPKQIEPRVGTVLNQLGGKDVMRISCAQSDRVQEQDVSGRLQKRLDRATSITGAPTLEQVGPVSTIQLRTIRLEKPQRTQALRKLLDETEDWDRVLVFVATRYAAEHVSRKLRRVGIDSAELHGKLDQEARLRRLDSFRKGRVRVLLATDVASRGLDVVGLPAVVNFDLPRSTADFVHRIGRTGRAGRPGTAVTFVTPATEAHLDLIETRHLADPVEREVLPGFEPDEVEWEVQSTAARTSTPGTEHSSRGLAHDRMHGGIKGRRKSKKDRQREKAVRAAAVASSDQDES